MREFDLIIQQILDKDQIGYLFVVDIEFDQENADAIFEEKSFICQEKICFPTSR